MSISLLVLDLMKFSFMRDLPKIRKLEISPSEFLPVSGDWGELGMPNYHECPNKMLLNASKRQSYRFYSFIVIKRKLTRVVKLTPPTGCWRC